MAVEPYTSGIWGPVRSASNRRFARIFRARRPSPAEVTWMPTARSNPVPAVLEYIPYRKREPTAVWDFGHQAYIAGFGYTSVRDDLRAAASPRAFSKASTFNSRWMTAWR